MDEDDNADDPDQVACDSSSTERLDAFREALRGVIAEFHDLPAQERAFALRRLGSEQLLRSTEAGPEPMGPATAEELDEALDDEDGSR